MAWIEMRTDLRSDPRVVQLAASLVRHISVTEASPERHRRVTRSLVVGLLHQTWSLFDEHTEDGLLAGYTPEALDDEVSMPGWADLLASVGWLEILAEGLRMPDFDVHNYLSAKRRAQGRARTSAWRERTAASRERHASVTKASRERHQSVTTGQDQTGQKQDRTVRTPPSPPAGGASFPPKEKPPPKRKRRKAGDGLDRDGVVALLRARGVPEGGPVWTKALLWLEHREGRPRWARWGERQWRTNLDKGDDWFCEAVVYSAEENTYQGLHHPGAKGGGKTGGEPRMTNQQYTMGVVQRALERDRARQAAQSNGSHQ